MNSLSEKIFNMFKDEQALEWSITNLPFETVNKCEWMWATAHSFHGSKVNYAG